MNRFADPRHSDSDRKEASNALALLMGDIDG
jgi:hypothetical protein